MINKHFKKYKIPDKPGVYFFFASPKRNAKAGRKSEILYIGKATSLRDRVKSYLPAGRQALDNMRGPLIVKMVQEANSIDWQETDSVLEALILEAFLIKKHQPKYNTKEKDDKSFNYVCITKEEIPKVIIVRGRDLEKKKKNFSNIFGPFTKGSQLKEAMSIVRRIFPYLDDKSKNYAEFYRQINLVPDLSDTKLYKQNIKNIKLFFQGKKKEIQRNLKKEMNVFAKKKEFEEASEIKRQIFALSHINDVALLKGENYIDKEILYPAPASGTLGQKISLSTPFFRIEAYDIAHMGGKNMAGVMVVVDLPAGRQGDGEVNKSEYKKFKIRTQSDANDTGALKEVLERRFAHNEWNFPRLIVVDGSTAQINSAKKVLIKLGIDIPIVSVVKNDRHKPIGIKGDARFAKKYEKDILLANSEAHRFAITYHKKMRGKNFLKIS